jgi:hypothetical protein
VSITVHILTILHILTMGIKDAYIHSMIVASSVAALVSIVGNIASMKYMATKQHIQKTQHNIHDDIMLQDTDDYYGDTENAGKDAYIPGLEYHHNIKAQMKSPLLVTFY